MTPSWTREVLDEGFLRGLDGLVHARRRVPRGRVAGPAAGGSIASGLDWVDHRPYEAGDDLRHLDWPLLARIGRPYVRCFLSERAIRLDVLVDVSRSMTLGAPPKRDVACALAFVFAYVGLRLGDSVGVAAYADGLLPVLPARRGAVQLMRVLQFLSRAPSGEKTDLRTSLGKFAEQATEIGKVVVLSDLLDENLEPALAALRVRGFEVAVVRLRSSCDEEPEPALDDVMLLDVETGHRRRVALSEGSVARYRHERGVESEKTERICARFGIRLAKLASSKALTDLVFLDLRKSGLLD